jgi:hypothetical protein
MMPGYVPVPYAAPVAPQQASPAVVPAVPQIGEVPPNGD